jgi:hypothetical protein
MSTEDPIAPTSNDSTQTPPAPLGSDADQTPPRERRRRRAGEARASVTLGIAFRARLRRMAVDMGISESRLLLTLVREALHARKTARRTAT